MRFIAIIGLALAVPATSLVGQEATQILTPPGASSVKDAASYGIGYDIGMNFAGRGLSAEDVTQADLIAGLMDALAGKEPAAQADVVRAAMEALEKKIMDRRKNAAAEFLAANKKQEGVQVTQSGLQYKVLKAGTGASPKAESTVTVHYEGKFVNGEIFDSSLQRGEPTSFGVTQVIPGWTEALMRMKVGDKWQLVIPPELGYGERGFPPAIGPHEALVFEVELLEVK